MVDFSFKRAEMEAMHRIVASMLVLDHHKTAQAELCSSGYSRIGP
jgi:hypothetical protein